MAGKIYFNIPYSLIDGADYRANIPWFCVEKRARIGSLKKNRYPDAGTELRCILSAPTFADKTGSILELYTAKNCADHLTEMAGVEWTAPEV